MADNIPEFYETDAEWEASEGAGQSEYDHMKAHYDRILAKQQAQLVTRELLEQAIGFLSAPDRERILERAGYSGAEIAAYFRSRGEGSLPCLQPRGE